MVNESGKLIWEMKCPSPRDCWKTPDGNYLFCHRDGVVEKLDNGRTLWDYTAPQGVEVQSLQPMWNGHMLVLEAGRCRIRQMDNMTGIHFEIDLEPPPSSVAISDQFRGLRRAKADGHFFVCRKAEREIEELDSLGKSLRRIPVEGEPHMCVPLPNGNLLMALGSGHRVVEMNRAAEVIWELHEHDIPGNPLREVTGLQRLPNGNTVVCNSPVKDEKNQQSLVFEVNPAKELVWAYGDSAPFQSINQIHLTSIPGNVMEGEVWR